MWPSYLDKKTRLLPIKVSRVLGLQAALEQGIPLVAILSDGLLLEFTAEYPLFKKEFLKWRSRVKQLARSTSQQWHAWRWHEEGISLAQLRPGSAHPEKHLRRWHSKMPRILIRADVVY